MADKFTKEKRAHVMSRIGGRNTTPELFVRSLLHRNGYRFRLHRRDLPGKPDVVLPRYRTVVFVHGCFWHGHDCERGKRPTSNQDFWNDKLQKNLNRDLKNIVALEGLGWTVCVIWQCELKSGTERLINRLQKPLC
jgi:DNA mismatch endonuclease, patch repair protein